MSSLDKKSNELLSYIDAIVQHFVVDNATINPNDCPMSLSKHEMRIIDILGQKEYSTMSELAENIQLAVSTLTGIIDQMVEKKYVLRGRFASDRRLVIVKLDKEGEKLFDLHRKSKEVMTYGILNSLEEEEQDQIIRLFGKIANKITKA
ncbi:MAG: MarR family transcriptional regulator [Candidatus Sericytochromatia bacterium]